MAPRRSRRAVCLPALPWDASLSISWGTSREGRRTAVPGLYLEEDQHLRVSRRPYRTDGTGREMTKIKEYM